MARFGYEVEGDTEGTLANSIRGNAHACPEAGKADSITVFLTYPDIGDKIKCAIFRKSDNVLIGVTEERADLSSGGWATFNFAAPKPDLTAQDYILCAWSDLAVWLKYHAVTIYRYYKVETYNSYPDPFDGTIGDAAFKYSIYCDYTPTPVGWTGKISGVTNPAKIMGVAVANIAKAKGVA